MGDTPPVVPATDPVVAETIFVRTEGGAILEMDLPLSAPIAARVAKQEIIRVANLDGDPWVEVDVVLVEEVADDTSTEAPPAGDTSTPVPAPVPVPSVADPAPAEPAPAPDPVPAPDAAPEPVPAPPETAEVPVTVDPAPVTVDVGQEPEPADPTAGAASTPESPAATDSAPTPEPAPAPVEETPADPDPAAAPPQPLGNASAEEWRAYAVTRGMAPDEANALSRDQLRDAYKAS